MEEHCKMEDIFKTYREKKPMPGLREHIQAYFYQFAKPIRDENGNPITGYLKCRCGERLDGIIGTFEYGIVHGEGPCRACGWPCRTCHHIEFQGEEIFHLHGMVLQYHSEVTSKEELTALDEALYDNESRRNPNLN